MSLEELTPSGYSGRALSGNDQEARKPQVITESKFFEQCDYFIILVSWRVEVDIFIK